MLVFVVAAREGYSVPVEEWQNTDTERGKREKGGKVY